MQNIISTQHRIHQSFPVLAIDGDSSYSSNCRKTKHSTPPFEVWQRLEGWSFRRRDRRLPSLGSSTSAKKKKCNGTRFYRDGVPGTDHLETPTRFQWLHISSKIKEKGLHWWWQFRQDACGFAPNQGTLPTRATSPGLTKTPASKKNNSAI